MANDILQKQGTTVVWNTGGDADLTLASLANGNGRAGDEHDFGAAHAARARLEANFDFNAAPTAGLTMGIYWSSSADGTNYDGECTGTDAAYNSEDDAKRLHYVCTLVCSNDTDPQRTSGIFFLPARYGLPVVMNASGQALTATEADQWIKVTPLIDEVQ